MADSRARRIESTFTVQVISLLNEKTGSVMFQHIENTCSVYSDKIIKILQAGHRYEGRTIKVKTDVKSWHNCNPNSNKEIFEGDAFIILTDRSTLDIGWDIRHLIRDLTNVPVLVKEIAKDQQRGEREKTDQRLKNLEKRTEKYASFYQMVDDMSKRIKELNSKTSSLFVRMPSKECQITKSSAARLFESFAEKTSTLFSSSSSKDIKELPAEVEHQIDISTDLQCDELTRDGNLIGNTERLRATDTQELVVSQGMREYKFPSVLKEIREKELEESGKVKKRNVRKKTPIGNAEKLCSTVTQELVVSQGMREYKFPSILKEIREKELEESGKVKERNMRKKTTTGNAEKLCSTDTQELVVSQGTRDYRLRFKLKEVRPVEVEESNKLKTRTPWKSTHLSSLRTTDSVRDAIITGTACCTGFDLGNVFEDLCSKLEQKYFHQSFSPKARRKTDHSEPKIILSPVVRRANSCF